MSTKLTTDPAERSRNLLFLATPCLWERWPFLPLIRSRTTGDDDYEGGVLFVLMGLHGMTGYAATVWLMNLFTLPHTLDDFLSLPKEVYDTPEEVFAAGWRVD
jgi:hypothetical protein